MGEAVAGAVLAREGHGGVPALEVEHDHDDEDGGQQVHDVLSSVAEEGVREGGVDVLREEAVDQVDEDAFEGSLVVVARDRDGGEDLPDDALGDVDGDEDGDTVAEAVFVHDLVEEHGDEGGDDQLACDEDGVVAEVVKGAVLASDDETDGLEEDEDDREELGHALDALTVLVVGLVLVDDARVREEHDDHGGCDYGRDTQLHQGAAVGGQDGSQLHEGVGGLGDVDSVEGDVAADQVDKEAECGDCELLGKI